VLVVDEAGMVGSRQMERVLSAARDAGAKVVLVGDPEQLQAIEAGAAFRALAERHGAAEISEVRRQREAWQREATRELATGRTGVALGRYERAGGVVGHATQAEARSALVEGWAAERQESPQASRIMLAHTRADVAELNRLAREGMRAGGGLGREHQVATENGPRGLAVGDRVMFLRNERALGAGPGGRGGVAVKNGTLGTVAAIEAGGERLTVRLDGTGGQAGAGEAVTFYLRDYGHLEHGYAATVHKAQGVTVDQAHVLAGAGMDRHTAYVALTRHREGVALHWSREAMGSREGLTRTLSRERAKDTSLDYDKREVVAAFAERRGLHPLAPAGDIAVRTPGTGRSLGQGEAAPPDTEATRPAPLLPAFHDPRGRDSQGRGTTPGEIAAAVERDQAVAHHRGHLAIWMAGAYRDPGTAWDRLEALEREEGGPRGAERAMGHRGPEILGELRGKAGWFASRGAKVERQDAVRSAEAVARGLVGLREAEERARGAYLRDVEAQRARDAVAVPGLSRAAWAAVQTIELASAPPREAGAIRDSWGRSTAHYPRVEAAWARVAAKRPEVVAELRAFEAAATQRLGEEGVRELLRGARVGGAQPQMRDGRAAVGRVLAAASEVRLAREAGERARELEREAQQERLGLQQGRGMRM
jgi:hypothetical protein